ncbi:MAG: SRPBCC domain-containing protein [Rhodospirillales bacterium]|nr:SRPBCC domain-containing protein [Rhodospirillales bacterium]
MATDEKDCELVLQRELPFARELVWKAMTDPAHVNNWWGPDGFTCEDVSLDFQVGGIWKFDMVGPDGTRYPNHSVFKEITPPSRMVFDHGDGQRVWFEAFVILEETVIGTLVTLRHIFPSQDSRDEVVEKYGAIEGGKQHLAKLEAYVREILSCENRSDSRSKMLSASPSEVFAAISDSARVARWWGPAGFTNSIHQFEFCPGGKWLLTMHGPDGKDYPNEGRFTRIEVDKVFEVEHLSEHHFLLTIELQPKAGGTEVKWRQTFDTIEHYQHIAEFVAAANEQNLERLAAEVQRGKSAV